MVANAASVTVTAAADPEPGSGVRITGLTGSRNPKDGMEVGWKRSHKSDLAAKKQAVTALFGFPHRTLMRGIGPQIDSRRRVFGQQNWQRRARIRGFFALIWLLQAASMRLERHGDVFGVPGPGHMCRKAQFLAVDRGLHWHSQYVMNCAILHIASHPCILRAR